jgi:hypothetical protein
MMISIGCGFWFEKPLGQRESCLRSPRFIFVAVRNFGRIAAFRGAREGGGAVIFGDQLGVACKPSFASLRLSPKVAASATFVPRKRSPVIIDGRRA